MKALAVSDLAKLLAGCASLALATGVAHGQTVPDGGQVQDTGQVEDTTAPPAAANDGQDIVVTAQRQSQICHACRSVSPPLRNRRSTIRA